MNEQRKRGTRRTRSRDASKVQRLPETGGDGQAHARGGPTKNERTRRGMGDRGRDPGSTPLGPPPTSTELDTLGIPVLRPVNAGNNSEAPRAAGVYPTLRGEEVWDQLGRGKCIAETRVAIVRLLADCSPAFASDVSRHLHSPTPRDETLLDGWSRCGRADSERSPRMDLRRASVSAMTPLGVACLVRYARAWVDASEARLMALAKETDSSIRTEGDGSRRQGPGRAPQALDHATSPRSRE